MLFNSRLVGIIFGFFNSSPIFSLLIYEMNKWLTTWILIQTYSKCHVFPPSAYFKFQFILCYLLFMVCKWKKKLLNQISLTFRLIVSIIIFYLVIYFFIDHNFCIFSGGLYLSSSSMIFVPSLAFYRSPLYSSPISMTEGL